MKIKKYVSYSIIIFSSISVFSQNITSEKVLKDLNNALNSKEWRVKDQSIHEFIQLPEKQKTGEIKDALFNLFEKEITKIQPNGGWKGETTDEGEAEYFFYLVDIISESKEPRAFPIFVKLGSPGPLSKYGIEGVEIVINQAKEKNTFASLKVLTEILDPKNDKYVSTFQLKDKIKQTFIEVLSDPKNQHPDSTDRSSFKGKALEKAGIRLVALQGLAKIGGGDIISLIEKYSKNDPYFNQIKNQETGEFKKIYMIRDESKKLLDKLKRKEVKHE